MLFVAEEDYDNVSAKSALLAFHTATNQRIKEFNHCFSFPEADEQMKNLGIVVTPDLTLNAIIKYKFTLTNLGNTDEIDVQADTTYRLVGTEEWILPMKYNIPALPLKRTIVAQQEIQLNIPIIDNIQVKINLTYYTVAQKTVSKEWICTYDKELDFWDIAMETTDVKRIN